ncbi:MAG TPA: hypothetical protein VJ951_00685 [Bacteroidales bacterium]|nr:hypothetical protein [Bacteroidales bacterium]
MSKKRIIVFSFVMFLTFLQGQAQNLTPSGFSEWEQVGNWELEETTSDQNEELKGEIPEFWLGWKPGDGDKTGVLRSEIFVIEKAFQVFEIAGMWGRNQDGALDFNRIQLVSHPGEEVLRETMTNNYSYLTTERWSTRELIGEKVRLEIKVEAVKDMLGSQFPKIALNNYRQVEQDFSDNTEEVRMQAVKIDEGATPLYCRSIPFYAVNPAFRGNTIRKFNDNKEIIPLNVKAEKVFLLGMINYGWEHGVAHWSEHPEMLQQDSRKDQNYIGNRIGILHIKYKNEVVDTIPLIVGSTVWFSNHWAHGASHDVSIPCQEPFASRPELMKALRNSLMVYESEDPASFASDYKQFYLVVKPRKEKIVDIVIENDLNTRGNPLVSGISYIGKKQKGTHSFGTVQIEPDDTSVFYDVKKPADVYEDAAKLSYLLYNRETDLPDNPDILNLPDELDATSIRFLGGKEAGWLSNVWTANIAQINDKFVAETGEFRETGADCPWYGGYNGIGTWNIQGIYPASYSRTSDHYVTLALRHIDNPERENSFVDFVDYWLYFFRNNRDPEKGPPNDNLDISRYPDDAPPHWSMELNNPPTTDGAIQVNEIYGDEEMDGHAATIIGRWFAWRLQGGASGDWLKVSRDQVFEKNRWQSTIDATEFICWLMDYTGMDLVYSEGEFTGWGGIVNDYCLVPDGMETETNPEKIKENYANSNMYEPYPNYACMAALQCAAEMADSIGNFEYAHKWREYADKIREAMLRQLISGGRNNLTWKVSPYSILTTFQDRLVQAFFSLYAEGLDTRLWDQEMLEITLNTFREHMTKPYGYKPVLAMGYGQGWLTHSALILDQMDDADKLLINAAKYSYDKNMDYVDIERGIDWRKWAWIVPEGVNILPDGSWYRINDLSNGANQGPVMHAIEAAAGVDDSNTDSIKIMPRIPESLEGISVKNHTVLIHENNKLVKAKIDFEYIKNVKFIFSSNKVIPNLSLRIGPYSEDEECESLVDELENHGYSAEILTTGRYKGGGARWIWINKLKNLKKLNIGL